MDLTFSREEQLSILRVMLDVSMSDGHVDKSEIVVMSNVAEAIGIQANEITSVLDEVHVRSVSSSLLCLGRMKSEKKAATIIILKELIHADGVVDENEVQIAAAVIAAMA